MRITVDSGGAGGRLDRLVAASLPEVSRATVMKYLKEGKARLNGRPARPGLFVREGDEIDLPGIEEAIERIGSGRAEGLPAVPRSVPRDIGLLYEDEYMVVVDKPPGLVMHPGTEHEDEGLDLILRRHFGASTRLVHRIDRDTSGIVVAARGHPDAARRLTEAFREGDVEKTYLALVRGVPSPAEGTVDAPLIDTKHEGERVRVDPHGKPARTDYRVIEDFGAFAWIEVRTHTGRRHQIRAHLAHIGHPLCVDHVYGKKRRMRLRDFRPDLPRTWKNPLVLARQPLHANHMALRHPKSGEEMRFEAPLPADLAAVLELLRGRPRSPE